MTENLLKTKHTPISIPSFLPTTTTSSSHKTPNQHTVHTTKEAHTQQQTNKKMKFTLNSSYPIDESIGQIPILTTEQLHGAYNGKRILIVGGTRGVGLGIAKTLAASEVNAAEITIVGRSETSAKKAIEEMTMMTTVSASKEEGKSSTTSSLSSPSNCNYILGDIGSVVKAKELVKKIQDHVKGTGHRYDCLIQTAAIFPNWDKNVSHHNEDSIEKCFAVAVVGRYFIYKNMDTFMY